MDESKTSQTRVAFVLLCGLAVCCGVMYATADGADIMREDIPDSIQSDDVAKAGMILTTTPDTLKKGDDGRERLLDFFNKVEENIATEVQSRKADIAAIRAQMAKNMELNLAARKKMKTLLMQKMAQNAKIAKDNLNTAMRQTQRKFAAVAAAENKRHKEDIKRFRATRALMRKNKKEAQKSLEAATLNQQRSLAALDQATNAHIKSTNKHIAQNAADMKSNAKKAAQQLQSQMDAFDNKMANVKEEAKKGRSKLAQQAATQDKKFREYANNKVKEATAQANAEFAKVRATMAKDRAHADAELSHATSRMKAALKAREVLQDERFASTVSDIAAAKKEAADRVNKFQTNFKLGIMKLKSQATKDTAKLMKRQSDLAETVTKNKADQAVVNNKVNAELKRMVALGDERYNAHIKADSELSDLMKKNKEDTKGKMEKMAADFNESMNKIQEEAKKDRAHAENALSSKTDELYNVLKKNQEAQDAKNKELTDATVAAQHAAEANLRDAKADFTTRLSKLTGTVKANLKKNNEKIEDLTGVVAAEAVKSAEGRTQLKTVSDSNRNDVEAAVRDAIAKGEAHATKVEQDMKAVNDASAKALKGRVTLEISKLRKSVHTQLDEIELESKEARAAMKAEILGAVADAATLAKKNLDDTVKWSEGQLSQLNAKLTAEETKGSSERGALSSSIAADKEHALQAIADAMAAQNAALLVQQTETNEAIAATNKELDAQASIMKANAIAVGKKMDANKASIQASLESSRAASVAQLASVSQASADRFNAVVKAVSDGVAAATAASDAKFTKLYSDMADQRKEVGEKLAGEVSTLNAAIAKRSALNDVHFSKTVADLAAAKAAATADVDAATSAMKVGILATKAKAKETEEKVQGQLAVVTGMIVSDKAKQHTINKHVDDEMSRILTMSNNFNTENQKQRGAIRDIMNKNKAEAARYTKEVSNNANTEISKVRSEQAASLLQFKQDLTKSTEKLFQKMAEDGRSQAAAMSGLNSDLAANQAQTAGALKSAKEVFASRALTLTNKITANAQSYEDGIAKATGAHMDWKTASAADRENIRTVRNSMVADLHKNIDRAIAIGEARQKGVEEVAMANIESSKKALLTTISESVENMADNVFATVQGNRQKIADNYLSLKAYSASAADKVQDYLAKGKGRNLGSIGDLLKTVGDLSTVKTKPAAGVGFGASTLTSAFSGKSIKVDNSVSKVNGLVNEYVSTIGQIKARWPLGLGRYLLSKLEIAMQGTGALEVDKVADKAGNFVFINARAVGLSSKLSDFESLAVKMTVYESTLSGLTAKLPATKLAQKHGIAASVPPPEWQGN